ncbi:hypothetical protein, partial [Pseudomonas typographi]|uniref:hypothetical protein n=1 Tax=Pseudomonas typographi TaxID=2715964 RepID=UPI001686AF77
MPVLALTLSALWLTGCSSPEAQWRYVEFDPQHASADYGGLSKFTLAKSILLLQPPSEPGTAAALLSLPAEAEGAHTQFGFQPVVGTPAMQLSTLDSTRLVHRLSLAQAAVPAATRAATPVAVPASIDRATAKPSGARLALPLAVDVQRLLNEPRREAGTAYGVVENSGNKVALELAYDAVPADTIETRLLDLAKASGIYFYSACRTATLTFLSVPFKHQQYTVTVADPNFVQTVALDTHGQITSHSSCGVDKDAGSTEDPVALATLNRAVAQARSVARAWDTLPMPNPAQAQAEASPMPPP